MTDYLRDPNNLPVVAGREIRITNATDPAAYEWPVIDISQHVEAVEANARFFADHFVARRSADDAYMEDLGYANAQELPGMWDTSDFLGGVDEVRGPTFGCPPEDVAVVWQSPQPITVEFRLEADQYLETLRLLTGDPTLGLVPPCEQQIPARGTE